MQYMMTNLLDPARLQQINYTRTRYKSACGGIVVVIDELSYVISLIPHTIENKVIYTRLFKF